MRAALDARGVSIKELARRLAGPDATDKQVENVRGQIYDWLRDAEPNERNRERLGAALDYPADYFKGSGAVASSPAALDADELRLLIRETVVEVLETEQFPRLAELRDAADRIERAVALLLEPPASERAPGKRR